MIVKFKHISISNFLSLGNAEFDLERGGYVLVSGVNNNQDDSAKSNGSGKSTLFEAISWVLTGETIRGAKDVVNLYGNDGAVVDITLSIDNNDYRILRSKDSKQYKTNLKIWINSEDKSGKGIRDTEKLLAEYLPDITSSLIGSVIILGQGLPQRFTNNTPSGRKDVLEKLSKSDFMIDDLKIRITNRKTKLSQDLRHLDDTILSYNSKKTVYQQTVDSTTKLLLSLGDTDDLDAQIRSINNAIEKLKSEISLLKASIDADSATVQQYRNDYLSVSNNENAELRKIDEAYNLSVREITEKKSVILATISSLESEVKKLESIVDVCPTCGQKLPNVVKPDTSTQRAEILRLRDELSSVVETLNTETNLNQQQKFAVQTAYEKKKTCLSTEAVNIKRMISSNTDMLNNKTMLLQSNISNMDALRLSREQFTTKQKTYRETVESTKTLIASIDSDIIKEQKNRDAVQSHLDIVSKFYTIITRDFRGYLLKNVIDFINSKAKEYSMEVFDTDKIDFSLDGNNISIGYDNKQYENLSGGEKQKVDVIVQFAIRDMLCRFLNFGSNILVVDEIFDNLDSMGCRKVINLISKKLKDINTIYIITHHSDIDIPYDSEVRIIKGNNGVSHIE